MVRSLVLCCALGMFGLAVGCDFGSDSKSPKTKQEEAVADSKAKLDGLDKKLNELKDRAAKATGDEKAKLDAKVAEATAKREAVVKKHEALKTAAADKWEAARTEATAALEEYRKAVE
jgi:hypothetical protein